MNPKPRWLQRMKQRQRAELCVNASSQDETKVQRPGNAAFAWISVLTLIAAVAGIGVTWYLAQRTEDTTKGQLYTDLVDQTRDFLPQLRRAEEMTSARLADIESTLKRPDLSHEAKRCLEGLRINATGEFGAVQSLTKKIALFQRDYPLGPPSELSAAEMVQLLRDRRWIFYAFFGLHSDNYAAFNSERVRLCVEPLE